MHHSGHYASGLTQDESIVLQAVLDHLPVGISVVDRAFRVLAVNRLFIEMLDFPPELFAAARPTLEQLTLFNAERGEYGPGDPQLITQERMRLAR